MVLSGAEGGVVIIQTFGAICNGMLMSKALPIFEEHLVEILATFFLHRAEMHVGGFASGWKGFGNLQN